MKKFGITTIVCLGFVSNAIAAGDFIPEKTSVASNVFPQHQLKNEELKSAFPKPSKTKKAKKKVEFKEFYVKEVRVIFQNAKQDVTKFNLSEIKNCKITQTKYDELKQQVIQFYLDQDYLMPQVVLNKKAAEKGILEIDVYPVKIANAFVVGDLKENELLQEYLNNITSQNIAKKNYTEKMLGLINKMPGVEVEYELSSDSELVYNNIMQIDLILLGGTKKATLFTGANNFSPNDLGKYQFSGLSEIYRPFSSGDSLILHGATTNYPDRLHDIGVGYGSVINSYGTSANVMASYAKDDSNSNYSNILPNSRSDSIKASLVQQILLNEKRDLEVELAMKHLSSTQFQYENNSYNKTNVSKYTTGILESRYLFSDDFGGENFLGASFTQGIAGTENDYADNNPVAKKHFNKSGASYVRNQKLMYDFSLYLSTAMSHSDKVLPNAEESVVGGNVYGRGYVFAALQGTKMKAGVLELRYTKNDAHEYLKQLQPYLFMDYAHVNVSDPNTNISSLRSYGGGLRVHFDHKIDLGFEIAQPCKKEFMADGDTVKNKTKYNIFVNKAFEF